MCVALYIHLKTQYCAFCIVCFNNRKKAVVVFGFTWQTNFVIIHTKVVNRKFIGFLLIIMINQYHMQKPIEGLSKLKFDFSPKDLINEIVNFDQLLQQFSQFNKQ